MYCNRPCRLWCLFVGPPYYSHAARSVCVASERFSIWHVAIPFAHRQQETRRLVSVTDINVSYPTRILAHFACYDVRIYKKKTNTIATLYRLILNWLLLSQCLGIAISLRISVAIILMSCQSVLIWLVSDVLLRSFGNHSVVAEKIFKKRLTSQFPHAVDTAIVIDECLQNVVGSCLLKDSTCTKVDCIAPMTTSRCLASDALTAISSLLEKSLRFFNTHTTTPVSAVRSAGEWLALRSAQSISKSINVFISGRQTYRDCSDDPLHSFGVRAWGPKNIQDLTLGLRLGWKGNIIIL